MNATVGMIPSFLSSVSNYIVLFMGIILSMNGSFTLGMITTFQGLLSSFMNPAETLISAGQTIREMQTDMERVEDVLEYPDDPVMGYGVDAKEEDYAKLKGEIELKNVSFGYSRLGNATVSGFLHALKARSADRHCRGQRQREIHGQQADHRSVSALGGRNPL